MAAPVRRNPLGPLRFSKLVKINEALWWDKTRPPDIGPLDTDTEYRIRIRDRSDFVAFNELGASALDWAIMERQDQNGDQMRLWPNDWYPGRLIQIPTRDSLEARRVV